MITIYSEKNIFEDIVFYKKNEYPNLREIFRKHANLYLNITEEDLSLELPKTELEKQQPQSITYNYLLETGMLLSPRKDDFYAINKDNSILADKPRSVFLLNCNEEKANQLQADYGVIVLSKDAIDDKILSGSYKKELKKKDKYENGWHTLLKIKRPPLNSIVISDLYLLLDNGKEKGVTIDYGKVNVLELIDALLPANLKTEFYVTILSVEDDRQELKQRIEKEICNDIKKLRKFNIIVEIFWIKKCENQKIEALHKRRLLCNYVNASTHYGLSIFKKENGKFVIRKDNDFIFNRVYCNIDNYGGDTEFESLSIGLKTIKDIVQSSNNRLLNDA